jgi:hypothetical protein
MTKENADPRELLTQDLIVRGEITHQKEKMSIVLVIQPMSFNERAELRCRFFCLGAQSSTRVIGRTELNKMMTDSSFRAAVNGLVDAVLEEALQSIRGEFEHAC